MCTAPCKTFVLPLAKVRILTSRVTISMTVSLLVSPRRRQIKDQHHRVIPARPRIDDAVLIGGVIEIVIQVAAWLQK